MWKVPHPPAAARAGRRKHLLRASLVATIGLIGSASVAAAITPGEPFTVEPDQGGPFTAVSVSGANCTGGPEPFVSGTLTGAPDIGVVTQFTATPDENGDWTGSFTVPPNTPAGQYQVTATCTTEPNQTGDEDYQSQAFTVLAGDPATITVSPRTARAGEHSGVMVSGTLCLGEDASVEVGIFERAPAGTGDAGEFLVRTTAFPDEQGTWATELTIPASANAGTYGVSAQCIVNGSPLLVYEAGDIVLTAPAATPAPAPPATPVDGQPQFTG